MPSQIALSWTVSVAGTSRTPSQAAAALIAVPLYANPTTDPVLGQLFGLSVDSDLVVTTATGARRDLVLSMSAPPPFPCHPAISTPPVPPYPLTVAVDLEGDFVLTNGSATVPTTENQLPTLDTTSVVQFAAQPGVNYSLTAVGSNSISISPPYSGQTTNSDAVEIVPAPVTLAAVYSSSPLDSANGSGARTVSISYDDSLGAPGTVVVALDGGYPTPIPLAGGTIDIATITAMHIASVGGFGNSVGQITLSSLSEVIAADDTQDEAQLKLDLALVYLPPSYFALAQQGASAPQLTGPSGESVDFFVTTNSPNVPTSSDMTGALAAGNVIQFAIQEEVDTPFGAEPVTYVVRHVGPKLVILETAFTGFDFLHRPVRPDEGTRATRGDTVLNRPTGATLVSPSPAAPPSAAALAAPFAQFVNPGIAVPPPNPPLKPATMLPAPTLLSGYFTQTLQLALAVPVTPAAIVIS